MQATLRFFPEISTLAVLSASAATYYVDRKNPNASDAANVGTEDVPFQSIQAAVDKDQYVLGNVEDQLALGEKDVLSGLQYEWGKSLETIFAAIKDGSFFSEGKETVMINVANGGLSMTQINDVKGYLTEEDLAIIDDVYQKLGEDAIELPEV